MGSLGVTCLCVFVEVGDAALALHRVQTAVAGCNSTPLSVCVCVCVCLQ